LAFGAPDSFLFGNDVFSVVFVVEEMIVLASNLFDVSMNGKIRILLC
jgi:hypothetical protein